MTDDPQTRLPDNVVSFAGAARVPRTEHPTAERPTSAPRVRKMCLCPAQLGAAVGLVERNSRA